MGDPGHRHNFASLLEQSRQLARQTGEYLIQRNVEQIEDTTRKLQVNLSRSAKDATKNKGRYLLATKGFDVDKLSRNLNEISFKLAYEPLEYALSETDLEGALNLEHDQIIISAIQEAKKETLEQFRRGSVTKLNSDWDKAKSELLEVLGVSSMLGTKEAGPSTPAAATPVKSMDFAAAASPMTPLGGAGRGTRVSQDALAGKMVLYGRVIEELNKRRKERHIFPLIQTLQQAAGAVDDTEMRRKEVSDCWDLMGKVVGEFENSESRVAEAAYEVTYSQDADALSRRFLEGAKQFLEKQYERVMSMVVARNARVAELGGEPGLHSLARAYSRTVALSRTGGQGLPGEELGGVWADIYYALRAGGIHAAIRLALSATTPLQDFVMLLQTYAQHGHVSDEQQAECRQVLHSTRDPYKKAIYTLLARQTPSSLPSPISTTQDWMWFHLSLILQEDNSEVFASALQRLQVQVTKFGPDHFNAKKQPLLYFQVLLITLQFERAVEFLWTKENFAVEALHFAASMYFYGILRVPDAKAVRSPDSIYSEIIVGGKRRGIVDFPRMLWHYALALVSQRQDLALGLNYIHLLRDTELEDVMLKDFVISTREVDALLGSEGKEGLVQRVLGDERRVRTLRQDVATTCEERADLAAAVKLYHEAGQYAKVLSLLNATLGPLVSSAGADRQALIALAIDVHTRYSTLRDAPPKPLETLRTLLQIATFFDLCNANRLAEALQRLESVGVLPFDPSTVSEKVELFAKLDEPVKRSVVDVILAAMTALFKLHSALVPSPAQSPYLFPADPARLHEIQEIKTRARALATFGGRIQYRLPSDVTSRLLQLQALMN